jgi:hypothetical protein
MKSKVKCYGIDLLPKHLEDVIINKKNEVCELLESIDENEIIAEQENFSNRSKSISKSLTFLLEDRLKQNLWVKEVKIFNKDEKDYQTSRWSVDFAKDAVGLEIAFNHEEGTAWNILKGYISSKSTIILKDINTIGSIIITATNNLKRRGGFDGSIGSFEKYEEYMMILGNLLEYPVILIGIEGPDSFFIKHKKTFSKKLAKIEKEGN